MRMYRTYTMDYWYTGPSRVVQQVAIAVAAQNIVLPIKAPTPNATWELTFHAPNIACDDVALEIQRAIEQSIYDYLVVGRDKQNCHTPPLFAAWYPRLSDNGSLINEPYVAMANSSNSSTVEPFLPDPDTILTKTRVGESLMADELSFFAAVFPGLAIATHMVWANRPAACLLNDTDPTQPLNNAYNTSRENPLGLLGRNATVLQCRLLNSTYKTKFDHVNGEQNVAIELLDRANDSQVPLMSWVQASDVDSGCAWTSSDEPACRADKAKQTAQMAYQGILQAFTTLIAGHWTFGDAGLRRAEYSRIGTTALILSRELSVLTKENNVHDPIIDNVFDRPYGYDEEPYLQDLMMNSSILTSQIYSGIPRLKNESSNVSLGDMIEDMFRKIVVSFMSSPELTWVFSPILFMCSLTLC